MTTTKINSNLAEVDKVASKLDQKSELLSLGKALGRIFLRHLGSVLELLVGLIQAALEEFILKTELELSNAEVVLKKGENEWQVHIGSSLEFRDGRSSRRPQCIKTRIGRQGLNAELDLLKADFGLARFVLRERIDGAVNDGVLGSEEGVGPAERAVLVSGFRLPLDNAKVAESVQAAERDGL